MTSRPDKPEPMPHGKGRIVIDLVMQDLKDRDIMGRKKYGESLTSHNGRNSLMDAYQEALDLCMYLRQAIDEQCDAPAADDNQKFKQLDIFEDDSAK